MSINFRPLLKTDLVPLRTAFYQAVSAPIDGMWDEVMHMSQLWSILDNSIPVGYFSIGEEQTLYQFFLYRPYWNDATDILKKVIATKNIRSGIVTSFNTVFLNASLDLTETLQIHSYLFTDWQEKDFRAPLGTALIRIEMLPTFYHKSLLAFYQKHAKGPAEWLNLYLIKLLNENAIWGAFLDNELCGTLEIRRNRLSPYAEVGMVIASEKRKSGLGTQLAFLAKSICKENGLKPVCSCTANNLGSLKLIQKTGFVRTGTLLETQYFGDGRR